MTPDPLDSGTGVPAVPSVSEPRRVSRKMTCEFCECELGNDGSYVTMSNRAKKLRTLEEKDTAKDAEIAALKQEIVELKAKHVPAPVTSERRGMKL